MTKTARLYGGSLYDLAAEEQLTGIIMEQMMEIRQLFRDNPDYVKLLGEPSIPKGERIDLIEKAFGAQAARYLVNFIKVLCERNLLGDFGGCCEEFTRRFNADNGISEAVVTSAIALNDAQMTALKEKLEKISGKKISLVQKIDKSVMAGLLVEIEGKQLDGTVASRMTGISKKLNEIIV